MVSRVDKADNGDAVVSAQAYTGTDVQVEYRFLLVGKDHSTTVIQDWSASDTCAIPEDEIPEGSSQVEVCVRQVGSTVGYDRYCMQDISG